MDKKLNKAFEQAIVHLKVSDIIFSKEINKDIFSTRKYAQIVSSIREIGLIEAPIVTFSDDGYTLLDGHLRLNALKDLDIPEVDCLVSTDNENFTYNKHVNRLSNVQEQKMIEKAINRGVSIERLAKVLDMKPENIRQKKNLLKNICPEVVEMLKDKIVSSKVFNYLARMKPERQIDATKIMVESKTFTTSFARSIWLATADDLLAIPRRRQKSIVMDFSHFTKLEEEINRLHGEYEEIEENYGLNVLNFTLVKGYVKTLVMNPRVNRYLRINNPDILEHLESIVDIDNLNPEE